MDTFGASHLRQHLPPHTATSHRRVPLHCNRSIFTRFGCAQRTARPLSGRTAGSKVGNPGEWGGERGGTRWGGLWGGARWSSLGEPGGENGGGTPSGSHDATEQGISGGSDGTSQPVFATITCDKSKWGAPVSRRTPLSTAICVRRQSSSLRLSQRRS